MFSRRGVLKKGRSRRLSLGRENTANSESRCNSVFSVHPLHAPTAESAVRHVSHRQGFEQGWANSWRLSPCFSMVAEPRSAFHFFCCCSDAFGAVIGGSNFWFGGAGNFFLWKCMLLSHFHASDSKEDAEASGAFSCSARGLCRRGGILVLSQRSHLASFPEILLRVKKCILRSDRTLVACTKETARILRFQSRVLPENIRSG